jgi:hypothetical protein
MFASHPQHESLVPIGLTSPGVQHWRRMEVMLHAPWFLLTVDVLDEDSGISFAHTWCIAWEHDLADALHTMDTARIRSLVCMLPGWATSAGHWASREVREVWLTRTEAAEEYVSLLDAAGQEFGGGLRSDRSTKVAERRLLLQLPASPLPKTGPGRRRTLTSARGGKAGA